MLGNKHICILCCIVCMMLSLGCISCSPRALREARCVVDDADSIWAEGKTYNDSIQLANAFNVLGGWRWIYPDEYVHACYHYGKLLREKDDPAYAMQVFIQATHARTRDLHILGRVYNNMGDIAHRAVEFPHAYSLFKHSANCFWRNGDTLNYYYTLNDMAFELAELGEKDSCYAILNMINKTLIPENNMLIALCYYTQAKACLQHQQYDSVLHYAHLSKQFYPLLSTTLQLAQGYSYLNIKDSAVYYASIVLHETSELFNINSALYILTQDDDSKDRANVRQIAADRSDVQKLIEIQRGKLSQAVQLLEQDLNRKPNLMWLYASVVTLIVLSISIEIYRQHQKRTHSLLSQKVEDLTNAYSDLQSNKRSQIEQNCEIILASPTWRKDISWKEYEHLCESIDSLFYFLATKLKEKHILNEQEIRLCILVLLSIGRNQIAEILPYAPNGVGKLKYRVAQKLGTEGKNLRKYLICLAIDEPYPNS